MGIFAEVPDGERDVCLQHDPVAIVLAPEKKLERGTQRVSKTMRRCQDQVPSDRGNQSWYAGRWQLNLAGRKMLLSMRSSSAQILLTFFIIILSGGLCFSLGDFIFCSPRSSPCPRSETLRSGTNELTGLKTTERRGAELMTSSGFAKNSHYRGPCRVVLLLSLLR